MQQNLFCATAYTETSHPIILIISCRKSDKLSCFVQKNAFLLNCICLNSYTPGHLLLQCSRLDDSTPFVLVQLKESDLSDKKVTSSLKSNLGWCYLHSIHQACSLLSAEVHSWERCCSQCCSGSLLCHPAAFQGHSQHRCHWSRPYRCCFELSGHYECCLDILPTCFVYTGKSHLRILGAQTFFVCLPYAPQTWRFHNSCPQGQKHSWKTLLARCSNWLLKSHWIAGPPHCRLGKNY